MSYHKTYRNPNSPFKRDSEERRFTASFIVIMGEYYRENNKKDWDIFEIDWNNFELIREIAKTHNAAVDYALQSFTEALREDENDVEAQQLTKWINDGVVGRCKYYHGTDEEIRKEMLGDYIRDARNSVKGYEIFQLKTLEKKWKTL